jgi:type VI secretion system secreted protein Hcp
MAADNFLYFPSAASGGLLIGKATQPEGESTDDWMSKKKAVEIASFGFGISQAETTGSGTTGSSAGKAKFEEFTIEKDVDQASAPLFVACTAGAHFPAVMLIIRKTGGSNLLYLQYIFQQVFVTGVNWSGGGGEENVKESIKFKFGAMGIQYIQQLPTGAEGKKMSASWSAVTNTATLDVPGGSAAPSYLDGSQS